MPLTVREIAQQVKPGASEIERTALVERIAHWTRERLLAPLGRQNPGTGRHRRYSDAAVIDVMILDAMADTPMPIATMKDIIDVVRKKWPPERRWLPAGVEFNLVIEMYPWGTQPYFVEGQYKTNPQALRTIIINLGNIVAATAAPPPQSETGTSEN